ncbi:MAG: hypothetical protein ACC652_07675 [Acidimicrobiales bacterium]
MKRTVIVLVALALLLGACGESDSGDPGPAADGAGTGTAPPTSTTKPTTTTRTAKTGSSADAMAAAMLELITKDNTFGGGPPPFTEYLIQTRLDPTAGDPMAQPGTTELRPLTEAERAAIEAVVTPFGPIRWIEDPADWRTDDLMPVVDGSVILGVGEPAIDGASALVPISLWCSGLCGTWFTYQLNLSADGWTVTGIDGPIAIS